MADVIYKKGQSSNLDNVQIKEGQILVTEDTGEMYVDVTNSDRKKINETIINQTYDKNSQNAQSGIAVAEALSGYVVAEVGKGLSSNDFTNEDKEKLGSALQADDILDKMDKFGTVELDGTRLGDVTASVKNFRLLNLTGESCLDLGGSEARLDSKGRTVISKLNTETDDFTEVAVGDGVVTLSKAGKIDVILNGVATPTDDNHGANKQYVDEAVAEALSGSNVQADWQQNDETANDYVKNRPGGYIDNDTIVKIPEKYLDIKNTNIVNGSKTGSLRTVGSAEESSEYTIGTFAFAEGDGTTASGYASHAEGDGTKASGNYSHAEGYSTTASTYYSHAEGNGTTASGKQSHAEGWSTTASDSASHAEGNNTKALGSCSHAEGANTKASGENSHAEGTITTASGLASHAEGAITTASGRYSHAEGKDTKASSDSQHVQGKYNIEDSNSIYADIIGNGENPSKLSNAATVDWQGNAWYAGDVYVGSTSGKNKDDGSKKLATEDYVNTKMDKTNPTGTGSFSLNRKADTTVGDYSFAEGDNTQASGSASHAEGSETTASGQYSHAEGNNTKALGNSSHAEGTGTTTGQMGFKVTACQKLTATTGTYTLASVTGLSTGLSYSVYLSSTKKNCGQITAIDTANNKITVDGYPNIALSTSSSSTANYLTIVNRPDLGHDVFAGHYSHAEGYNTTASGSYSHAEGNSTKAFGHYSHAEGSFTTASGNSSHAEGNHTTASGSNSHAEGNYTTASGLSSHAEGNNTTASGDYSHAEGNYTTASGENSHAEGRYTKASSDYQHVQGKYNIEDTANIYADIIGNGSYNDNANRSNAATVDWQGNAWYAGAVTSNAADYAEFFEWLDGNPDNEDRVGYLVALDGEKIRFANPGDEILGIISANPAVLGDNYECNWNGKYLTDEFGRILYDKVEEFIDITKVDEETGEIIIEKKSLGFFDHPRINPDYDPDQEYINRRDRSEWAMVGMLGKLFVRDDSTAQINGYVSAGEDGIATASTEKTNMRVLSRVNDHIVKVLLK